MKTLINKDSSGWRASTEVELADRRVLEIRTYKAGNGRSRLSTRATVSTLNEAGHTTHIIGYGGAGGDFNKEVTSSTPTRITEKLVREQHERVLAELRTIRVWVELHYASREPAMESIATVDAAPSAPAGGFESAFQEAGNGA